MARAGLRRLDVIAAMERHGSVLLGLAVLGSVLLVLLPIPPFVLDVAIGLSFAAGIVLVMSAIQAPSPTAMSTFPSLLLLVTLLRLGITIASTKMILLHAHAGEIVRAFGNLIVGGDVVVGLVVFVVLSAVQFIVVAKGSDRVAEVSARFTLDGIPGRQMSIDADLRSGAIHAGQASQLRQDLEQETYLYGAMDGAMKFIKGDSIATLIVALVNIAGGLAIGMVGRGMDFGSALRAYTVLTVGDGLVAQLPSLLCSLAAGILITRISRSQDSTNHLGREIFRQLAGHPQALLFTGAALWLLAAMPGMPFLALALVGTSLLSLAIWWLRVAALAANSERALMPAMARDGARYVPRILDDTELGTSLPLRVRISPSALAALRPEHLNQQLGVLRRRLSLAMGLPFPGVSLLEDALLPEHLYVIDVDEVPMVSNTLVAGQQLVSSVDGAPMSDGVAGYRPGYRVSTWQAVGPTEASQRVTASAEEVLCEHLFELCEQHAVRFIGVQETRFLLDRLAIEFRDLVAQFDARLTIAQLVPVLKALLGQRISIRNLRGILQVGLDIPAAELSTDAWLRQARILLATPIIRPLLEPGSPPVLAAHMLDAALQMRLEGHLRTGLDGEPSLTLPIPELETMERLFRQLEPDVHTPLLTSAVLRPHLERLARAAGLSMPVLALEEASSSGCAIRLVRLLQELPA